MSQKFTFTSAVKPTENTLEIASSQHRERCVIKDIPKNMHALIYNQTKYRKHKSSQYGAWFNLLRSCNILQQFLHSLCIAFL